MNKGAEINILRKIMEEVCKNVEQACFLHEGERNLKRAPSERSEMDNFPLAFSVWVMCV